MITAVDTNVLIDVLQGDPRFGPDSRDALSVCLRDGSLIVCDVVLAETRAAFEDRDAASSALERIGVGYVSPSVASALLTGQTWRAYRSAGGPRTRVVADFLVGAHAMEQADRLLTRDRGFYRRYFTELTIVDPTTG